MKRIKEILSRLKNKLEAYDIRGRFDIYDIQLIITYYFLGAVTGLFIFQFFDK